MRIVEDDDDDVDDELDSKKKTGSHDALSKLVNLFSSSLRSIQMPMIWKRRTGNFDPRVNATKRLWRH